MADYVQLEARNDWGYNYVAPLGKGLTKSGLANAKLAVLKAPNKNEPVRTARLKINGFDITADVVYERRSEAVSDHGHTYTVNSEVPKLKFIWHGLTVTMPATDKQVWVAVEDL